MIIDRFAIMLVGIFVFLILLERLCREVRSSWKRRVILQRYAHTEQVLFALKEGETIVAVKQEQNTLSFMVSNQSKGEKEYE